MRTKTIFLLSWIACLFCFGNVVAKAQSVEVCLDDPSNGAGGTLTLKYIPDRDYTSTFDMFWTSQVVTFRYDETADISWGAETPHQFGVAWDNSTPKASGGLTGGDGFKYVAIANQGTNFTLAVLLGDSLPVWSVNYTLNSGGPVTFELITNNSVTNTINSNVLVQNIGEQFMGVPGGNAWLAFVNCGAQVFPVELLTFKGQKGDKGIDLEWITTSEINNDFFQVERSYDAQTFEAIGQVAGAGTSLQRNNYSYLDNTYTSNRIYYRLKQVDLDGAFEYSNTVEIRIDGIETVKMELYPNPAEEFVNVGVIHHNPGTNYTVKIWDLSGREVLAKAMNPESGTVRIELGNMASGIYSVELVGARGNHVGEAKLFKE